MDLLHFVREHPNNCNGWMDVHPVPHEYDENSYKVSEAEVSLWRSVVTCGHPDCEGCSGVMQVRMNTLTQCLAAGLGSVLVTIRCVVDWGSGCGRQLTKRVDASICSLLLADLDFRPDSDSDLYSEGEAFHYFDCSPQFAILPTAIDLPERVALAHQLAAFDKPIVDLRWLLKKQTVAKKKGIVASLFEIAVAARLPNVSSLFSVEDVICVLFEPARRGRGRMGARRLMRQAFMSGPWAALVLRHSSSLLLPSDADTGATDLVPAWNAMYLAVQLAVPALLLQYVGRDFSHRVLLFLLPSEVLERPNFVQ